MNTMILINQIISESANVDVKVKAELSPKDEYKNSYLKLTNLRFKAFISDVRGQMVDTSKNQQNEAFSESCFFITCLIFDIRLFCYSRHT